MSTQARGAWEPPQLYTSAQKEVRHLAVLSWAEGGLLVYGEYHRSAKQNTAEIRMVLPLFGEGDGKAVTLTTLDSGSSLELDVSAHAPDLGLVFVDEQGQVQFMEGRPATRSFWPPRRITRSAGHCHVPNLLWRSPVDGYLVAMVEQLDEEIGSRWRLLLMSVGERGGVVAGPFVLHDSAQTAAMPWVPRMVQVGNQVWVFFQSRGRRGREGRPRESIQRMVLDGRTLAVLEDEVLPDSEGRHLNPWPVVWRDQVHLFHQIDGLMENQIRHHAWSRESMARTNSLTGAVASTSGNWKAMEPEAIASSLVEVALDGAALVQDQVVLTLTGYDEGKPSASVKRLDLPSRRWAAELTTRTPALMRRSRMLESPAGRLWFLETASAPGQIWSTVEDNRVEAPRILSAPDAQAWQETRDLFITWTIPQDASGLAGFGLTVTETPRLEAPLRSLGENQNRIDLAPYLREGTNWVNLVAWDRAGNVSPVVNTRILVDSSPPLITGVFCSSHPPGIGGTESTATIQVRGETVVPGPLWVGAARVTRATGADAAFDAVRNLPAKAGGKVQVDGLTAGTNLILVALKDGRGRWSLPAFLEAVMTGPGGGKP